MRGAVLGGWVYKAKLGMSQHCMLALSVHNNYMSLLPHGIQASVGNLVLVLNLFCLHNRALTIMASQSTKKATEQETPHRQIRALYDEETITVYQAYSAEIAEPAVKAQRLNASPKFSGTRMTWIKTSWCWMMFVPYPFPFLSFPFSLIVSTHTLHRAEN